MTATTSVRALVKKRLYDLIVAAGITRIDGTPVQVSYAPNEREIQDERIFLGATRGHQEVKVLTGGTRMWRDDVFTIEVWVETRRPGVADPYDADTRCLELLTAVENVIADDPKLGFAPTDGMFFAVPTDCDGPDAMRLAGGEGEMSAYRYVVEVHARTK